MERLSFPKDDLTRYGDYYLIQKRTEQLKEIDEMKCTYFLSFILAIIIIILFYLSFPPAHLNCYLTCLMPFEQYLQDYQKMRKILEYFLAGCWMKLLLMILLLMNAIQMKMKNGGVPHRHLRMFEARCSMAVVQKPCWDFELEIRYPESLWVHTPV